MARGRETIVISAWAAILTAAMAWPVLSAPSERIFGRPIVGRHYDPFSVMEQFTRPIGIGMYSQPVTDVTGALLSRLTGPVAAYNALILVSFPLSAAAAFLLARYVGLSPAGAAVAAFAYAFSPFHLAQAAYHVHVAQTQWLPLYLLALWRSLDKGTATALVLLVAAAAAVTFSSFYGGLIAAVLTPVAIGGWWLVKPRPRAESARGVWITGGTLAAIGVGAALYAWRLTHAADHTTLAFPRSDLERYGAAWWSYLVPASGHPLLGRFASRIWASAGVHEGLLEHQLTIGIGILALGLIAGSHGVTRSRQSQALAWMPALGMIALAALTCALPPAAGDGVFSWSRPSELLHEWLPMFRSYARFGVMVQLMAVLMAGIGVDILRRHGSWPVRITLATLLALVAAEYAVQPSTLWRDVLPTPAHRWVVQQPGGVRALDCTEADPESLSVPWLSGGRISLLGGRLDDCREPNLPDKLAATGVTYMIARHGTTEAQWMSRLGGSGELRRQKSFRLADLFAVTASPPDIYTAAMFEFFPREDNGWTTWRWMGTRGEWIVTNRTGEPMPATLDVELWSFHLPRHLEMRLDGIAVQTLNVDPLARRYQVGGLMLTPGEHQLRFHPIEPPAVANRVLINGDARPLSIAVGTWTWRPEGGGR